MQRQTAASRSTRPSMRLQHLAFSFSPTKIFNKFNTFAHACSFKVSLGQLPCGSDGGGGGGGGDLTMGGGGGGDLTIGGGGGDLALGGGGGGGGDLTLCGGGGQYSAKLREAKNRM